MTTLKHKRGKYCGWAAVLVIVGLAGPALSQGTATFSPDWVEGRYWIVESARYGTPTDRTTGEAGALQVVGTYQTRFTVRFAQIGVRLLIEPKVVGQYEFGEHPNNYEIGMYGPRLLVSKTILRGTDMADEPFERVTKRLPTDPICWWQHPWKEGGVFPESLTLVWPALAPTSPPGSFALATANGADIAHKQIVTVRPDATITVDLRDSMDASVIGNHLLVFTAGKPWYEVVDAQGQLVNRIVEVGIR